MNPSQSQQQDIYFDHEQNRYWREMSPGRWVKIDKYSLEGHLLLGLPLNEANLRAASNAILLVQRDHSVDFAGCLAGYRAGLSNQGDTRILIRSGPKFIDSVPGNCDMVRGVLERMFGDEQLPYLYGWIKKSLEMFKSGKWMAGQVLVLCGEPGAGKNLFAWILQLLFGGRKPGKPFSYMIGQTNFNSDFMGCELLTIEDESSHVGIQARRSFGAKIKDLAVNEDRWLHKKHAEPLTVTALQRLFISLNDEPERLLVLPPIESDIEDKIMLLKAYKHPMPMPTDTPMAKDRFSQALAAELPAFVDFLERMPIPAELQDSRYGIRHYHHPEILEALQEQSPEEQLLHLIDEVVFPEGSNGESWYGKSSDLARRLKGHTSKQIEREARDLLPAANSCGKYLGRLAARCPDRVVKHAGSAGTHRWTVHPPEQTDDAAANNGTKTPRATPAEKSRALIEHVKAIVGARPSPGPAPGPAPEPAPGPAPEPAPEPQQAEAGPRSEEMLQGEIQAAMRSRGLH